MALTKVTGQVIKNTTDVTVGVLTVTNTLAVGGTVSIGGTLTYEDVTNIDSVGLITARNGIIVGSGITLSKDGDGFFTGVTTATTFVGALTGTASGNAVLTGSTNNTLVTVTGSNAITGESLLTYSANDKLEIKGTGEGGPQVFRDSGNGPDFVLHGSRGTIASPAASAGTDLLGNINFAGYDGSGYFRRASINARIDGTVVDGSDTLPTALIFQTGTTSKSERLRITSAGLIGINQDTPTCQLQIDSGSSGDGTVTILELNHKGNDLNDAAKLNFARAGSDIGSISLEKVNNNNTTDFIFNTRSSNTVSESMRITGDGKVGINESSPDQALHVKGVNSDTVPMRVQSTGAQSRIGFEQSSSANSFNVGCGAAAANDFGIYTNDTERVRVYSTGHVTKPYHVTFGATGNQGVFSVPAGQVIEFNQHHQSYPNSRHTAYDTSTYKFTAPVSGYYFFFTNIRLDNYSEGYIRTAFLSTSYGAGGSYWTNPSTGHVITYPTNSSNIMQISTSVVMYVPATHEVYVYQDPSSDSSYTVYLSESSFGGYFIG